LIEQKTHSPNVKTNRIAHESHFLKGSKHMSVSKKIACLGSGSVFFTSAIPDIVLNEELAGSELVLYDIDHVKSAKMTAMAQHLVSTKGLSCTVRCTESLSDAIDNADFVVTSIGGSGAEICSQVYESQYHNADMRIPAKYGIHQVIGDTCGPAGMMMGLRAIPVYMHICHEMEKRCPNAVLLSHSNPMAVLCRAMHKYSNINVIGICHGVQNGMAFVSELLSLPPQELEYNWIGTNHYYWFTSISHKGKDVYPQFKKRMAEHNQDNFQLARTLSSVYGHAIVYPSDDHIIEFSPFLTQVSGGQKNLPFDLKKSAKEHGFDADNEFIIRPATEEVKKAFFTEYDKIIESMLTLASRHESCPRKKTGDINGVFADKNGKPTVSEGLGELIAAIVHGKRNVCIANIQNKLAVPNLPYDAEVEIEALSGYGGVKPVHMGEAPRVLKGILEKRFVWQDLVADAAVKGDRDIVLQALMIDEMAIWPDNARQMRDELLAASKPLLPQFFK
jgi:alpha-galactosidase